VLLRAIFDLYILRFIYTSESIVTSFTANQINLKVSRLQIKYEIVKNATGASVLAFEVALVENIQRKTMNPIEEAEAYKKYINEYGWGGVSDLAGKIGKSISNIRRMSRLASLWLAI
jgi:ParB/RepB/Spo0J family partition protein